MTMNTEKQCCFCSPPPVAKDEPQPRKKGPGRTFSLKSLFPSTPSVTHDCSLPDQCNKDLRPPTDFSSRYSPVKAKHTKRKFAHKRGKWGKIHTIATTTPQQHSENKATQTIRRERADRVNRNHGAELRPPARPGGRGLR